MPTWADVKAAAAELPEVAEGTAWGRPCLRVRKDMFVRLRDDGATLVVRVVDEEDKEALIKGDPETFFTTPHYDGYAYVLVRLAKVDRGMLGELIEDAWRLRAPKKVLAAYEAR
jgi:hypothetical protein